jgi:hypothetical protein
MVEGVNDITKRGFGNELLFSCRITQLHEKRHLLAAQTARASSLNLVWFITIILGPGIEAEVQP